METSVHYVIDGVKVTEDKDEAKQSLKNGSEVVKVTRIEYQSGPTKTILATLTKIFKTKDI